jgi:hypothetical protein
MCLTLMVIGLVSILGLASVSNVNAAPDSGVAAATSPLLAPYAEYRSRHGHVVKCFREFVLPMPLVSAVSREGAHGVIIKSTMLSRATGARFTSSPAF